MSEPPTTAAEPPAQVTPDAIMQLGLAFWGRRRFSARSSSGSFGVRSGSSRSSQKPGWVKPSYVGGMLEMANARLYGFWGSLTEGLRTGAPQNEAKGGADFFEALYADPARLAS